jgi:hypothetical protein
MRQKITHTDSAIQLDDVALLGREDWRVIVNNGNNGGHLSFVLSLPKEAVHYRMILDKGVLRFERQVGAAPTDYLQKDLVSGETTWRPEKPYRSSGRENVVVNLGLEMVL